MKLKLSLLCAFLAFFSSALFAESAPKPLNQVSYQLSAEQWANSQSAKVTVNVRASVTAKGLENVHTQLMSKLKRLSNKAAWHITRFYRYQGQSGLESLQVSAEARLPTGGLATLRSEAKKLSKPGEKFTIGNIQYSPSLAEFNQVRAGLRAKIYRKAAAELTRLNKVYPAQKFALHTINFMPVRVGNAVGGLIRENTALMATRYKQSSNTGNLAVSSKVVMTANVVLAAKMNHASH